jgi:putative transposase
MMLFMRDLAVLFIHLITTIARLAGPGGARSVVAESVLVKQQLLILNRSRHRSPNLRVCDRVVAGLCALLMRPGRLIRSAIVLKPSTLLSLHRALKNRKYRLLFSLKLRNKPGPKGPSPEVIAAVVQMKQRNPTWGCPRIAQQIAGFRYSNQQGCGSADSGCSLPTKARLGWSFMAHFPRSHEGQPLEPRPLSM